MQEPYHHAHPITMQKWPHYGRLPLHTVFAITKIIMNPKFLRFQYLFHSHLKFQRKDRTMIATAVFINNTKLQLNLL